MASGVPGATPLVTTPSTTSVSGGGVLAIPFDQLLAINQLVASAVQTHNLELNEARNIDLPRVSKIQLLIKRLSEMLTDTDPSMALTITKAYFERQFNGTDYEDVWKEILNYIRTNDSPLTSAKILGELTKKILFRTGYCFSRKTFNAQ
jgi:hypothetical protein